jgi:murein DD-endopeptidase MepM/ murein hydrolase activator NlpD
VNSNPKASKPASGRSSTYMENILAAVAWLVAIALVFVALLLAWRVTTQRATASAREQIGTPVVVPTAKALDAAPNMPDLKNLGVVPAISRQTILHTTIPQRPSEEVKSYTVAKGDSLFVISKQFAVKPETVLWANFAQLNDNPDTLSVGMNLNIPPVDGVYYKWVEGDSIEAVANRFGAKAEDVLNWPGNQIDLADPKVAPGTWILVPGGHRESQQWLMPTIPRGKITGVSLAMYGSGACEGGYSGAVGSGNFIWPTGNHFLSGNDYSSIHLGIDLAASDGAAVVASDSGVVVFAGWSNTGYGNMVMLDHGNGYQTLYGHLSGVNVGCGRSVSQGGMIGAAGSTGNSTGTHLHFEVRFQGGFIDPWYVLPAP